MTDIKKKPLGLDMDKVWKTVEDGLKDDADERKKLEKMPKKFEKDEGLIEPPDSEP